MAIGRIVSFPGRVGLRNVRNSAGPNGSMCCLLSSAFLGKNSSWRLVVAWRVNLVVRAWVR